MPEVKTSRHRFRLLIVSPDVVSRKMAGPGIRYWELANALAAHVDVTLAVLGETDLASDTVDVQMYAFRDVDRIRRLEQKADVVLGSVDLLFHFPYLADVGKPLIIDLYGPFILENLEMHRARPMPDRREIHEGDLGILRFLMRRGDFFICASERQRDLWLGVLLANDRVNPLTYEIDESLRGLIDVVPFGIPDQRPVPTAPMIKGIIPGIAADDKVILWGGGIWNWLDPLTPVRAMEQVIEVEPRARLVFMGGRHPNSLVPEMHMAAQAEALAEELRLIDRYVFFNDSWVPYQDRVNFLLESDVSVSSHHNHVETRFSFRTRLLDCIWAGLPMVVTHGDAMAQLVEARGLGQAVSPGDMDGMAQALIDLLDLPEGKAGLHENFESVRRQLLWSQVVQPLVRFCRSPHLAADRATHFVPDDADEMIPACTPTSLTELPSRAMEILRQQGASRLIREIVDYIAWRMTR